MKLTKEQYIQLSNIFHNLYDGWTFDQSNTEPAATFSTVVDIVEQFLSCQVFPNNSTPVASGIQWKKGPPPASGQYIVLTRNCNYAAIYHYEPDDPEWDHDEVLWHIGPIPKEPNE